MCGRYASTLPPEMMGQLFKLFNSIDLVPRYNIAPTQPVAAIWEAHGRREAHFARWGLVPGWVKDPRDFPLLVNARVETMADKPAFRDDMLVTLLPGESRVFRVSCAVELEAEMLGGTPVFRCANQLK